jgi:phytoene dehydrogenase-like protein
MEMSVGDINNAIIRSRIVLVNVDYPFTGIKLIDPEKQTYTEEYWEKKIPVPSALVVYLGIDYEVDKLTNKFIILTPTYICLL